MIHPTAVIDPEAQIATDARVGPYAIIDGPVTIGPGCVIQSGAKVMGRTVLGARNVVHSGAVIGDWPQDRKFKGELTDIRIGDDNIFREGVTVHRATGAGGMTTIGSRCFFMVNSHVGHNCTVEDDVILINGALLGGHVHVFPRAIIGANCVVHQFCRIGRLAMCSFSGYSVDLPPFFIAMTVNHITQLNVVGLRRSGMPRESINALRQMFQLLFRSKRIMRKAIDDLPPHLLAVPEVQEFVAFVRTSKARHCAVLRRGPIAPAKDAIQDLRNRRIKALTIGWKTGGGAARLCSGLPYRPFQTGVHLNCTGVCTLVDTNPSATSFAT